MRGAVGARMPGGLPGARESLGRVSGTGATNAGFKLCAWCSLVDRLCACG